MSRSRGSQRHLTEALMWAVCGGRIVAGIGLLASPGRATEGLLGGASESPATQVLGRTLGARDVALGAGTLLARGDRHAKRWVQIGGLGDVVDILAVAGVRPSGTRSGLASFYALATSGAILSWWLQRRLS